MQWHLRKPKPPPEFVVVGGTSTPLRDVYDFLMRSRWRTGVLIIVGAFLFVNLLFALAYEATGGVAGVRPRSLADAFFFSVQTLGTLGYGAMYPESQAAHLVVTLEVVVGVFVLALVTGFTFSKFSSVRARIRFAERAVLAPFDGHLNLMLRVGNERLSRVIDAQISVTLTRSEKTKEGVVFYRMLDLALERRRIPNLARSWTVFHKITESSPLYRTSPDDLAAKEVELQILVTGLDETSSQIIHAQARYDHSQIAWGARHADVLSELPNGTLQIDLTRFNELLPTKPTPDFPYPRAEDG